jgi:hypothetical protein
MGSFAGEGTCAFSPISSRKQTSLLSPTPCICFVRLVGNLGIILPAPFRVFHLPSPGLCFPVSSILYPLVPYAAVSFLSFQSILLPFPFSSGSFDSL